jgi:signal peptidase I
MLPTLWIGDHLFVNKFVYGARIPLTDVHLPALRAPERGEVVVFSVAVDGEKTYPADRRSDLPREDFVKRIIGLPGERIDIVDGVVFVNGEPIESRGSGEHVQRRGGPRARRREVAIGARHFAVLDDPELRRRRRRSRSSPGAISCSATTATEPRQPRVGHGAAGRDQGPAFRLYWSWDFSGDWLELLSPATWADASIGPRDRDGSSARDPETDVYDGRGGGEP